MKLKELQILLDAQPSVSGSTFLVGSLYIISWILFSLFLILGLGLLLEGIFGFRIFLSWVTDQFNLILNEEQRSGIAGSFAFLSLVLAAVFGGVIILSRMVLRRNHYMIELEDWIYTNVSEVRRRKSKGTK